MIYLKKFENNASDYYSEITRSEFSKLYRNHSVNINKHLTGMIDSRGFARGFYSFMFDYVTGINHCALVAKYEYDTTGYTGYKSGTMMTATIFEIVDEWYVVSFNIIDSKYGGKHNYYKCDQVDGLLTMLKDVKFID